MSTATDWLTAVGTCGAVVVSLSLALSELRNRRIRDERKQAEMVMAWFSPNEYSEEETFVIGLHVQNASNQMIHDFVAVVLVERDTAVGSDEAKNQEYSALIGNVPPGNFTGRVNYGDSGMGHRHLLEYAFQDAGGRYWLRRASGQLQKVNRHPLDLFELTRPVTWQNA